MADYKSIHGVRVVGYTADPDNIIEGQIWYDGTAKTVQYQIPNKNAAGSWRTANSLNTGRQRAAGVGTQTAGLVFGGFTEPPNTYYDQTESYDGTSFSEVNDLNTGRDASAGAGTQTAALAFGGEYPTDTLAGITETWDGSSWTEVGDLNSARFRLAGAGANNTASLAVGGETTTAAVALAESWNGSAWTEVGDLNTARTFLAGDGTSPSAIVFGGLTPPSTRLSIAESWNGSSWTEVGDLNTARYQTAGSGESNTAALCFGGNKPPNTVAGETELWNGSSWAEQGDLNSARANLSGLGTSSLALTAGAEPSPQAAAEEWSGALTLDIGAWSTGGNLNTARQQNAGSSQGDTTSGLTIAGAPYPSVSDLVESYNGTAWTEVGDINTSRSNGSAGGTQTSAIFFAGDTPNPTLGDPPIRKAQTESWNGSTWTEVGDINTARSQAGGTGASNTSALIFGGHRPPPSSNEDATEVESWNGSSWTEVADLNAKRGGHGASAGSATAALFAMGWRNGIPEDNTIRSEVETYDGTSWSEAAEANTTRRSLAGAGTSTLALIYGGQTPSIVGVTEDWNGASWSEVADLSQVRNAHMGSGAAATSALAAGGNTPGVTAATEEWSGSGTTIKTVDTD